MGRGKKQVHGDGQPKPNASEETEDTYVEEPDVMPPQTAEDLLLGALEKSDLNEVVRILRDWCGSAEIRRALNSLAHRDPVDRFTHIRRHAVELYAKKRKITPATLMVKIKGVNRRKDASGSERYKLRMARGYLENDRDALICARALAEHWDKTYPNAQNAVRYIKNMKPNV